MSGEIYQIRSVVRAPQPPRRQPYDFNPTAAESQHGRMIITMAKPLTNDEFFTKLSELFDKNRSKSQGSVFLTQKR
ncbi:hypothetical protein V491_04232, partial [Pseudogymnoascus sp. VKM F-3775]